MHHKKGVITGYKENDTCPRTARNHLGFIQYRLSGRTDQMNLETELSAPSIYRATRFENSV